MRHLEFKDFSYFCIFIHKKKDGYIVHSVQIIGLHTNYKKGIYWR